MEHPVFRATELLDMAIQIERQGLEFYETCLGHAAHPQVKEALRFMVKEESRHIEVFTRMKNGLEHYRLPESYPGEMQAYLDSFVKDKVFIAAENAVKTLTLDDTEQTIEMAVGFEKRSILFYSAYPRETLWSRS
jgi:rubrerythrin